MKTKAYKTVDGNLISKLISIVGNSNVIYKDRERLLEYSYDEGYKTEPEKHRMPDVVVLPNSTEEVSAIMSLANKGLIPVTPRGAGSGLTGGAVPLYGGIIIAFNKMNRIIELDKSNMMITVEPGIVTNELNKVVAGEGLFFAGYPMSEETCFIGGNVAENAGGGRAVKYGVTGRYVLGLELVLPDGRILNLGGKLLKNVTGYNMLDLIIGSEGTLGIITKITLKLLPLPSARAVMMVAYDDLQSAVEIVPKMMTDLKIIPSCAEFMDKISIDETYACLNQDKPFANMEALLIIELDGNDQDVIRQNLLDIGDYLLDHGALDAIMAETPKDMEKIWKIRSYCPEALYKISDLRCSEDLVVPPSKIPELVKTIQELSEKYGVIGSCMGHIADGNVHAVLSKREECSPELWHSIQANLLSELYLSTKDMGGTISGEHGVGNRRINYLPLILNEVELELMKKIKEVFDPNNILNPGKIII